LEPWELERIKEKVQKMAGRLEVTVFAPDNRYRIWYYPPDGVALYARMVWDEAHHRERSKKAWPREILDAMENRHTKVHVRVKNGGKVDGWFGAEHDMKPVGSLYRYIADLG